ncbi:WXG100 family type VII secretion target [Paenibacillus lemnae]|uniref:ESAT-6-like protein n=1 Tax=Paenibacillus lemnae TaxID=1330551 RepID=A0A848M2G9_PAELE|nr:WXG100 family type VII secretion target [Paenibacillus lemnae]NMO94322.1 WXG100 family type VII secretion target [Paenibacillus lemnae]
MTKIKINPEQLDEAAARFLACSQSNLDMAVELKGIIDGMSGEWEGVTRERFYQSYTGSHEQLQSVSETLKTIGDELKAIADRFRSADESS